jgi:hypothetical protein
MSFTTLAFLCMIIFAATHLLDGAIERSRSKKSMFLLALVSGFAASVLPALNFNRYVSLNLLFVISAASYIYVLTRRKRTREGIRMGAFILFDVSLYILQLIWEITVNIGGFYYFQIGAVTLYCTALLRRPSDSAVSAYFGVWFLQLLSIIKNIIVDSYIYFDLSNPDVMQTAMFSALLTFFLSDIVRYVSLRRREKRTAADGPVKPNPGRP